MRYAGNWDQNQRAVLRDNIVQNVNLHFRDENGAGRRDEMDGAGRKIDWNFQMISLYTSRPLKWKVSGYTSSSRLGFGTNIDNFPRKANKSALLRDKRKTLFKRRIFPASVFRMFSTRVSNWVNLLEPWRNWYVSNWRNTRIYEIFHVTTWMHAFDKQPS